jgi:hypothetical protein
LLSVPPVRALPLLVLTLWAGCGPESGARLEPLGVRTALVGVELVVTVHADAASGLVLDWDADIADLKTRPLRPSLSAYAGGEAVFRWTPLAGDLGAHTIVFRARTGSGGVQTQAPLAVTVLAGADPLTFREPAGDGTTFDPAKADCAEVALLVDDPGAAEVTLAMGDPWTEGGALTQDGPLTGTLRFCPSAAQLQAAATSVFPFALVATDASGARAEKRYTIVLGALPKLPPPAPTPTPTPTPTPNPTPTPTPTPTPGPMCDLVAPAIAHSPHKDITTTGNLHLYATVTDASGVYDATVLWSTTKPADLAHPDLAKLQPLDMAYLGGPLTDSDFGATIPNPVLASAPGTTATIYYVIRSTDTADAVDGCGYNTAYDPPTGVHSFVVKRAQ